MDKIISKLHSIAKSHGVKCKFSKLKNDIAGLAHYTSGKIELSVQLKTKAEVLSTFFHELVHLICYKNKIWAKYHSLDPSVDIVKKFGVKVERFVDKKAEQLMLHYFPDTYYLSSYGDMSNKDIRNFLLSYYENYYNKHGRVTS